MDLWDCQCCFQRYEETGPRTPVVLSCGHTWCRGCLEKIVQLNPPLRCPKCRAPEQRSPAQLPRNEFVVENLSSLATVATAAQQHSPSPSQQTTTTQQQQQYPPPPPPQLPQLPAQVPACELCHVQYQQSGPQTPRLLACGHAFCEQCLTRISAATSGFACPACGAEETRTPAFLPVLTAAFAPPQPLLLPLPSAPPMPPSSQQRQQQQQQQQQFLPGFAPLSSALPPTHYAAPPLPPSQQAQPAFSPLSAALPPTVYAPVPAHAVHEVRRLVPRGVYPCFTCKKQFQSRAELHAHLDSFPDHKVPVASPPFAGATVQQQQQQPPAFVCRFAGCGVVFDSEAELKHHLDISGHRLKNKALNSQTKAAVPQTRQALHPSPSPQHYRQPSPPPLRTSPPAATPQHPDPKVAQLVEMGFTDTARNIRALEHAHGNIEAAVAYLVR